MFNILDILSGLPTEIVINICNESLSLWSDQLLNIQCKTEFPSIFFLPFLYKVRVGEYYIECITQTDSMLKLDYSEDNFLKLIQLLQGGYTIKNLEIISDMHTEFDFMKVLVNTSVKIKLVFFPYLYLYFFKEHPQSISRIYELNIDNYDLFEIMQMLVEENVKFPNLKRINIKFSCLGSIEQLNRLILNLSSDCFESHRKIRIIHYIEIGHIKDIVRYLSYRNQFSAMSNKYVAYNTQIYLVINNADILAAMKESNYINHNTIYKLSIGVLSIQMLNLMEEQIQFMGNLKEITTYSKLYIEQYITKGRLKSLQIFNDFSSYSAIPLGTINNDNFPNLSCLSISLKGLRETKFQIPHSLKSLQITNYGSSHSANFSCIDFSQCNLKTLYVSIEGQHKTIEFLNMSPRLSRLVISNMVNPKSNVENIKINTNSYLSCLRRSFPNYCFIEPTVNGTNSVKLHQKLPSQYH